jgi:hypothetical protein
MAGPVNTPKALLGAGAPHRHSRAVLIWMSFELSVAQTPVDAADGAKQH